jgi:hypothetical protein
VRICFIRGPQGIRSSYWSATRNTRHSAAHPPANRRGRYIMLPGIRFARHRQTSCSCDVTSCCPA